MVTKDTIGNDDNGEHTLKKLKCSVLDADDDQESLVNAGGRSRIIGMVKVT